MDRIWLFFLTIFTPLDECGHYLTSPEEVLMSIWRTFNSSQPICFHQIESKCCKNIHRTSNVVCSLDQVACSLVFEMRVYFFSLSEFSFCVLIPFTRSLNQRSKGYTCFYFHSKSAVFGIVTWAFCKASEKTNFINRQKIEKKNHQHKINSQQKSIKAKRCMCHWRRCNGKILFNFFSNFFFFSAWIIE